MRYRGLSRGEFSARGVTQPDAQVRQKLREQAFESHSYHVGNKVMQRAVHEMAVLQNDMMLQRIKQREHLQRAAQRELEMAQKRDDDLQRAADKRSRKKTAALSKTEATEDDPDQASPPLALDYFPTSRP